MDISTKVGAAISFTGLLLTKLAVVLNVDVSAYSIPQWAITWLTALCLILGSAAAGISVFEWIRAIKKDIKIDKEDDALKERNDKLFDE